MINIYLDIDGVLLKKDGSPAKGIEEFLNFIVSHFECYWLTTHSKGNNEGALDYLHGRISEKAFYSIGFIHPTDWLTYKTEAINFNKNFLWLDDYIFERERNMLITNNALEKLIMVDLKRTPNQLLDILNDLKGILELQQG